MTDGWRFRYLGLHLILWATLFSFILNILVINDGLRLAVPSALIEIMDEVRFWHHFIVICHIRYYDFKEEKRLPHIMLISHKIRAIDDDASYYYCFKAPVTIWGSLMTALSATDMYRRISRRITGDTFI